MKCLTIGTAILLLLGGCAGSTLFDDGGRSSASARRVDARWLDEMYRAELSSSDTRTSAANPRSFGSPTDGIDEESTLDDLVAFAIVNHPIVQAAYAEWAAAKERIIQAGTLPDPQLSYGIMVEQIDRDRDPIGHSFGVSQMLPWFGKLDAQANVQIEAARAAHQRLAAEQVRVARAVKESYADYGYTARSRAIVEQHRELLRSIEEVIRIRYRGAEVGLSDLLRVQAEGDQLDVELRDLEDMLTAQRARLNAAIGRPAGAVLPNAQRLPDVAFHADGQHLIALLAQQSPELRVRQAEVAARREAMRVARLEYYPDIMVGVEYGLNAAGRMARMDGGGRDTLTGMISINLPIWREKYDAGVREAIAEFGAALKVLSGQQYDLEAELKIALYSLRDAQRRADLYGDVLRARGEQILEATMAAYRVGDATYTDVVQAQRELLSFELAHERAIADRFIRVAEIEALIGQPIISTDISSNEPPQRTKTWNTP